MLYDLPLDQLKKYCPERDEPEDFDSFWKNTLLETKEYPLNPQFKEIDADLKLLKTFDVTFSGFMGQQVKAWLLLPAVTKDKIPCIVEYAGYGGGRGQVIDRLLWSTAGYAHFVMDTRGQGSSWSSGDTPDPEPVDTNPHYPGYMTRGILDKKTYYYRRVFTDAVRAVEAVRSFKNVDETRVAVTGCSQGGGITLAVSGLVAGLSAAMPDVPFLCQYRTAMEITDGYPYQEIVKYCQVHRDKIEIVHNTLKYFDGVNFAARAKCPALFSTGLMDEICPPRTVFAAYNHFGGKKDMRVWPYNHHEGGQSMQEIEKLKFIKNIWK